MNRNDVVELYLIAPIVNVPSIMRYGILCHKLAKRINHDSVAMQEIQKLREDKQIPGARKLHEYANLYFDAHNPMLCKIQAYNDNICVLRISTNVLDLPGVIIADRNASSDYVRFLPAPIGLRAINRERVFAVSWIHPCDQIDEWRHKSEKCAEVLVPDSILPCHIVGAYVANETALLRFQEQNLELPVCIKHDIFF